MLHAALQEVDFDSNERERQAMIAEAGRR